MSRPLIIVSILVIALAMVFILLRGRRRAQVKPRRTFDFAGRSESAIFADAVVVSLKGGVAGETGSRTCVYITLEVTPPDKEPYTARAQWLVEPSALPLISPGSGIKVKIDAQNPGIVYPGENWASYVSC
jgi:hypothetical protein